MKLLTLFVPVLVIIGYFTYKISSKKKNTTSNSFFTGGGSPVTNDDLDGKSTEINKNLK